MQLTNVRNWPRVQERYEAWWHGDVLDRPVIQIRAPKGDMVADRPTDLADTKDWFTNPQRVLPRLWRGVENTHYAGDAFPLIFPMSTNIPAIQAAYLGCEVGFAFESLTAWTEPIIEDWDRLPRFDVVPGNYWWGKTLELITLAAQQSRGRAFVSIPDMQGGGQIIAMLRGPQRLALDLYDRPELIVPSLRKINASWLKCFNACFDIIHRHMDGYADWLGVYSADPHVTVECDMCALISPRMFQTYLLPALEEQTEMVGRTVYHLDGPGSLPHLESILALPKLCGIQWVPGAGATHMSDWIELLQRIQMAGKALTLACEPWEVQRLLTELKPKGLLLSTHCGSVAEADALEQQVCALFGCRADR